MEPATQLCFITDGAFADKLSDVFMGEWTARKARSSRVGFHVIPLLAVVRHDVVIGNVNVFLNRLV